MEQAKIYRVADGDIAVWIDEASGCLCLKLTRDHKDPVELAEHEALELAELLTRLVEEVRG